MKWIVFTNKSTGKVLCRISAKEVFQGEIASTRELLAYENGIKQSDIKVSKG